MSGAAPEMMSLESIKQKTDNFSQQRLLGSGAFGAVYRGGQKGEEIAVKLLRLTQGVDETEQFKLEFENIWRISEHPNIIKLVGYCYEIKKEYVHLDDGRTTFAENIYRILCLEYMHNGSLQKHLHDESKGFDWQTRYKIIKGICEGLKHLHHGFEKPIHHLDLKPDNILLDENMVPKISDFGLSKLASGNGTRATLRILGTMGYLPPEYIKHNSVSEKFDIYGMGVITLRVIAGHEGYDKLLDMSSEEFIGHVCDNWTKRLRTTQRSIALEAECHQVKRCIEIALDCIHDDRRKRPTIRAVVDWLNETEDMAKKLPRSVPHGKGIASHNDESLSTPIKSGLVGGTAGTARDIEEKPWRLESLTISYLGLIDAFSFSYIDQAGKKQIVGPWGEGYSHAKTETIPFGPSEFVEEVSGAFGIHFDNILVMSLTFVTNIATYGPFGNPYHQNVAATPFRFMAEEDCSIVGFHGRSGQHLYSIGVYTCPSNTVTVRARPVSGQSLLTVSKSGPWGGSAGIARDIKEKPWHLDSITVSYLGLLDAFEFSYTDQAGKRQSVGPWGEGYHHDKIETIRFGSSEFLAEVSGAYGSHWGNVLVTSITFVTNKRTYGPYGNPNHQNVEATPFRFQAAKDCRIVGFHGRSGEHIYSIGVYTV